MSYIEKEPLCAWLSNMCVSENIIKAIENGSRFPPADVVEVRRGRWINNHCTVCGQTPIGEEAWTRLGLTPPRFELCMSFCPCCGAKMDGERREERGSMSYIKKEPLLQIVKEIQGKVFGAPLIVREIENAPEEDVIEVRQVNNFIQRLQNIPGAIYHSELRQVCKEFGFDYPDRKMDG